MGSRIIEAKGGRMVGECVNNYNNQGYNKNQGFHPSNDAKKICCRKEGHVRKDCPVWKCICEEETIGIKPKVGVNIFMVDWDQPLVDVSVTTWSKKALLVDEEQGNTTTSHTKRWNQVEQGKDSASRNIRGITEDLESRGHPNKNSYRKLVTKQSLWGFTGKHNRTKVFFANQLHRCYDLI